MLSFKNKDSLSKKTLTDYIRLFIGCVKVILHFSQPIPTTNGHADLNETDLLFEKTSVRLARTISFKCHSILQNTSQFPQSEDTK